MSSHTPTRFSDVVIGLSHSNDLNSSRQFDFVHKNAYLGSMRGRECTLCPTKLYLHHLSLTQRVVIPKAREKNTIFLFLFCFVFLNIILILLTEASHFIYKGKK